MELTSIVVGDGPVSTVLLHGFLGTGRNLRSLATQWHQRDPRRRFLLPDLTGHGASPALPPGATAEALARDVLETARAQGFATPLHLVGHSMGGRVALVASVLEPGAVDRIDLLDISASPIDPGVQGSRKVLEALLAAPATAPDRGAMRAELTGRGLSVDLAEWLMMNLTPAPGGQGVTWRFDRQALAELHPRVSADDLWDVVERTPARLRLVRGGKSSYVRDADYQRFAARGVPVHTLPEAGHYLHVEQQDALLDWLAQG